MSDASQAPTSSDGLKLNPLPLEERKFQLEVQQFEYEKSKSRGLGFFNANLGIIITAIIGTATIVVSYLQLEINRQSSDQQLVLQRSISVAQLDLEKSKATAAKEDDERKLELEIAKLLLEKKSDINTEDVKQVFYLRDIVMSALPSDVGVRITKKMADNSPTDEVRLAWLDGYVKLSVSVATSAAGGPPSTLTLDYIVTQLPALATSDARTRVADILAAAQEFNVKESVGIMLAYVLHSSNFFTSMIENVNYGSSDRLAQLFPITFPTVSDAIPYANDPHALANKVYGHRLGNTEPDDGWKYRGRGYLFTTGRGIYQKSGSLIGVDLIADPDKLLDSKIAARETAAIFSRLAKPLTVDGVVRQLNGAMQGFASVQAIYEKLTPGTPKVTQGLSIPPIQVGGIGGKRVCIPWC
jgi:predicted chitinase